MVEQKIANAQCATARKDRDDALTVAARMALRYSALCDDAEAKELSEVLADIALYVHKA